MLAIALAAAALASTPTATSVCPATDRTPIVSQAAGADTSLVPPGPDSLIVCRYDGPPGLGLAAAAAIGDRSTVVQLASELDAIPPARGVYGCPADFGTALLAFFGYPSGPGDVVRVGLSGCNSLTNGHVNRLALGAPVVGRLAALAQPLRRTATFAGYERLCGGPAPGRCRITQGFGTCEQSRCAYADRVEALNAAGAIIGTARMHRGRFTLTVPEAGRYELKLLADGSLEHGAVVAVIHAVARTGRTTHVAFTFDVP